MGATLKFIKSEWYKACRIYRWLLYNENIKMSQANFLQSNRCSEDFTCYRIKKGSFGKYLKNYDAGTLKPVSTKRVKSCKFISIEFKLVAYLE